MYESGKDYLFVEYYCIEKLTNVVTFISGTL